MYKFIYLWFKDEKLKIQGFADTFSMTFEKLFATYKEKSHDEEVSWPLFSSI